MQALIFDAFYDNYRGAICFVRVKEGELRAGMRMRLMATGGEFDIVEVGTFNPGYQPCEALRPGDVGYVEASIKAVKDVDERVMVLQGAGIKCYDDVYRNIFAGAEATGTSSGIAALPTREARNAMVDEMIRAVREAWDARNAQ